MNVAQDLADLGFKSTAINLSLPELSSKLPSPKSAFGATSTNKLR